MRVLFYIGSLEGGGAERQTLHYLRHLDRSRFEPHLHLVTRSGRFLECVPGDVPVSSFDEQPVPRLYVPGRLHRRQVADLAATLERRRIDVLCAVTINATLVAGTATRRRPTPWLAVEMADPRLAFDLEISRFRLWKRRLLAAAYRRADRVVAVSEGVREGLREFYGLADEAISTVPNFVDVEEIDRLASETGPRLEAGRFHIVSVGRLHMQKGHDVLLEALADLVHRRGRGSMHLHLLGTGPLEDELRRRVQALDLSGHVTFAGFVENPFSYIKACDLFCLPSRFEGLPLALLEAMACSVPVVATDCPSGPREVLDHGRCGRLVSVEDAPRLADAIERVIADVAAARETARAARGRVESEYSAAAGIPKLESLLERVGRRVGL
ncbi:MAG: glycosyltransferase [Planctomycetes bacterium]|nr:glycosyltransferase [Planctomycetota bacterium]